MRKPAFALLAGILALTYLAFQAELFEDEYEENHPVQSDGPAITSTQLSNECDKENAQEAFVVVPVILVEPLYSLPLEFTVQIHAHLPYQLVRDKSPPLNHSQDSSLV